MLRDGSQTLCTSDKRTSGKKHAPKWVLDESICFLMQNADSRISEKRGPTHDPLQLVTFQPSGDLMTFRFLGGRQ